MDSLPNPLINPEALAAWKRDRLTVAFLHFLKGRQMDLMEAWGRGESLTLEHQAQAVLLGKLVDLSHEHVAEQYGYKERADGE